MKREEFVKWIEVGRRVVSSDGSEYYKSEGRYWMGFGEGNIGLAGFDIVDSLWDHACSDELAVPVVESLGMRAARLFGGMLEHERGAESFSRGVVVFCCKHCGENYVRSETFGGESWLAPDGQCVLREMDVDDWNVAHRLKERVGLEKWKKAARKFRTDKWTGKYGGCYLEKWLANVDLKSRDYCEIACDAKEVGDG